MSNKTKIISIARACRSELERVAVHISPNFSKTLAGLCMYGSVLTWMRMKDAGLKPEVVSGNGHFFAVCDGLLVDVTATQFGHGKVVVRDYKKVQEMATSGEYALNHWKELSRAELPCDINLCGYRTTLRTALKKEENLRQQIKSQQIAVS